MQPAFIKLNRAISALTSESDTTNEDSNKDPRKTFLKRKPTASRGSPNGFSVMSTKDIKNSSLIRSNTPNHEALKGNFSHQEQKRNKCKTVFGERSFLPESARHLPPLLYTFPGSGNTWCRLLIEYATGIYTGSVYNDESLLQALPGEFTCNWLVSAVKAHPHTHRASELLSGHYNSDNNKCKRGGVARFEKAILLIRDPFDSIWSEYQRRVSQSHVAGIPKANFNWHRWQANAANLAHAYYDMWQLDHSLMERQLQRDGIIYLKYEDLKNKVTRVATLEKIVKFLNLRSQSSLSDKALLKRLECAFMLADNRQAHRSIDKSTFMTKDIAYQEEIACRMWNLFKDYAVRHGYKPWGGFNCTGYPKIPKINVGPQGDYDHRWVRPGAKLIDFRGKRSGVPGGNAPTIESNNGDPADSVGPNSGTFDEIQLQKILQANQNALRRPKNKSKIRGKSKSFPKSGPF